MSQKITMITPKKEFEKDRQAGQLILEAVLLMVIFLGVIMAIQKEFSDKNLIGALASGPWSSISHMMSTGSWDKSKSEGEIHPLTQTISREGDTN